MGKTNVTISVEHEIKEKISEILRKRNIKISNLVEDYLRQVIKLEEENGFWEEKKKQFQKS